MQEHGRAIAAGVAMATWAALCLATFLLSRSNLQIALVWIVSALVFAALPFVRSYLRSFALVVVSVVGGVALLEVALRIEHFGVDALRHPTRYGPYSEILGTGIVQPVDDSRLIYGLAPGLRTYFMGYPLDVNAQGFRDRAFVETKTPGRRRVLAIGTSITMGGGVAVEDAYPAALERELTRRGVDVEVYNCGVPAYPSALRFNLADELVDRYHPDDVVVEIRGGAFYDNGDVSQLALGFAETNRVPVQISDVERYSFAASGLYPPTNLRQRVEGLLARVGLSRAHAAAPVATPSTPSADYLAGRVRALVDKGHRQGFGVYLVFVRPMFAFDNPRLDQKPRDELTRAATAAGAIVVDTYSIFEAGEFPDDFQVFPGDNHPNARAHARFAQAIAEHMR